MIAAMEQNRGWVLEENTLNPVLVDRNLVLTALQAADPVERLFYLGVLGQVEQGLAEARQLCASAPVDPWRLLLLTAELYRLGGQFAECERQQALAWKHARSRSRQASTLHQVGARWLQAGDGYTAAAHFELALTMRRGFDDPSVIASSEQALRTVRNRLACAAVVLAGGRGVRLGGQTLGAKALIPLAGWPLADHVLLAASFAATRLQVGPARIALGSPVFCTERPAGAGPVAAIAAALARVDQPSVAVLAGDLPFIGPALAQLHAGVSSGTADVAVLVETSGRVNYLAAVWRTAALRSAIGRLATTVDAPVRALFTDTAAAHVPDFDACAADVDTPDDLRAALERLTRYTPERLPASPLAWPRLELHAPS
jgi:molybdopterin-guanine dinucleotide biosynthesis protein A